VNDVRFSPSGALFATGSGDKKIIIYDTKSLSMVKELNDGKNNHAGSIMSLSWINDDTIFSASMDKQCKLWDVKSSAVIGTMSTKEASKLAVEDMNAACANFEGKLLLSVTLNGNINLWSGEFAKTGINMPSRVVEGHKCAITSLAYSQKSKCLLSGDSDGVFGFWKDNNGYLNARAVKFSSGSVIDIKESADGNAYALYVYGMLFKLHTTNYTQLISIKLDPSPLKIAASRVNPNQVYVLFEEGKLLLYEGDKIKEKYQVEKKATALEINDDAGEIYIGDKKGIIHIHSLKDLKEIGNVTEYTNEITCLEYHPASKKLAASDRLKLLYIYDIAARKLIGNAMSGHSGAVWRVTWSPEGKFLATASLDFSVTVWDATTSPCKKLNMESNLYFII